MQPGPTYRTLRYPEKSPQAGHICLVVGSMPQAARQSMHSWQRGFCHSRTRQARLHREAIKGFEPSALWGRGCRGCQLRSTCFNALRGVVYRVCSRCKRSSTLRPLVSSASVAAKTSPINSTSIWRICVMIRKTWHERKAGDQTEPPSKPYNHLSEVEVGPLHRAGVVKVET